ncbi:MAG: hypothetical protein NUV67_00095 [archaeon]|nr:hypothetical protein [archaeon]
MTDTVSIPKNRLKELEQKERAFHKLIAEKEKNPFRAYSYKRLAEEGEDANHLFEF